MREIDEKSTAVLLTVLDSEINAKCYELKEKHKEVKLKRIFFLSCFFIMLIFLIQLFFKIFNVSLVITFIVYQGLALFFAAPFILGTSRKGLSKWAD